jgi:hypothetical protein
VIEHRPAARLVLLHNIDALLVLAAFPLFVATGLPLAGWFWATALWAANRFLQAAIERRARGMPALRGVAVMGASMLLRPWIGMLVLFLVTKDDDAVALSSVLLFVLVFSVDMATRILVHKNVRRREIEGALR